MLSTLVYVPHGLEQGWTTDPNVTDWSTNGPSGPYQCSERRRLGGVSCVGGGGGTGNYR